jgi:CO/xanthine dehydrogenase Mo-binding subunit
MSPREGVFDPEAALQLNAHVVNPDRESGGRHPNLLAERLIRRGDPEGAIAAAATVIDGTYRTSWVEHAFLAPEAGLAWPEADGSLTLHVATQWPDADLRQAATALGIPRADLRLVQSTIGGAFGGREDISIQLFLLLAARVMRAPERLVWDRRESVRGHGKRHPFRNRHRLGVGADGRFAAAVVDVLVDAGCYASTSTQLLDNALAHVLGPYAVPHVAITGRVVLTNNPNACAFRGFGANQVAFAIEQQVNKVAEALRLEPRLVRQRNFVRSGGTLAAGSRVGSAEGLPRTLERATRAVAAVPLPVAQGSLAVGRGIATAAKNVGYGFGFDDAATAEVTLDPRSAVIRIATAEVGQGSETVLLHLAATALALPMRAVRLEWRDTALAPDAGSTSASRQTMASGHAVLRACRAALAVVKKRGGWRRVTGGKVTVRRTWRFPGTQSLDKQPGRHVPTFGWATVAADVAVDRDTGQVTLLRVVSAVDAGQVIHPRLFEGQVEGGIVMGQGYALQERVIVERGMPLTLGFEGCGVPTAVDAVPRIESLVVETPDPIGPHGARGVGEITMIPVVPAITAAIHAACGVWIDELPASPLRVLAALAQRDRHA